MKVPRCNACDRSLKVQILDPPADNSPVFGNRCPCGEMTAVVWDEIREVEPLPDEVEALNEPRGESIPWEEVKRRAGL